MNCKSCGKEIISYDGEPYVHTMTEDETCKYTNTKAEPEERA